MHTSNITRARLSPPNHPPTHPPPHATPVPSWTTTTSQPTNQPPRTRRPGILRLDDHHGPRRAQRGWRPARAAGRARLAGPHGPAVRGGRAPGQLHRAAHARGACAPEEPAELHRTALHCAATTGTQQGVDSLGAAAAVHCVPLCCARAGTGRACRGVEVGWQVVLAVPMRPSLPPPGSLARPPCAAWRSALDALPRHAACRCHPNRKQPQPHASPLLPRVVPH